jgi:hypothetical protein
MKLLKLTLLLAPLVVTSCKKDDSPVLPPPDLKGVYVVGYEHQALNEPTVAKIWFNKVEIILSNGQQDAKANSVFVSGNDVYVAGYDGGVATIWKNSQPTVLSDLQSGSQANSVYVLGNDVYAAGFVNNNSGNNVATVWKNGVPMYLSNGVNHAQAFSVFVYGNDVYVAGFEMSGYNRVATIWKNNQIQNLASNMEYTEAKSVFVDGGDVYVAGFELLLYPLNGAYRKVWKNGLPFSISISKIPGYATSLFVYDGIVYVAGTDFGGIDNAKVWTSNNQEIDLSDEWNYASSIYLLGPNQYVAGYEDAASGDNTIAKVWVNGQGANLTSGESIAKATSVFVVN